MSMTPPRVASVLAFALSPGLAAQEPAPAAAPAAPPAATKAAFRHSFFVAGPTFTGIVDEDGKEAWDTHHPGARDGFVLPNGNVLVTWTEVAVETTRDGKIVFEYAKSKDNQELGTVERLDDGRTLITELGRNPRLLEVDAAGKIAVEMPLQPETDNAHMQTRMARKLPTGNYLVPHLLAFQVKEYAPDGKVVRSLRTDLTEFGGRKVENWPFTAIRLESGNTLVGLTHGNRVVEFDSEGKVAWQVSNDDLPGRPIADACGVQRLPNGNTVIASYAAAADGIKLFEVDKDKQIVWSHAGKHRVHHFQILTTNGEPLAGRPRK